MIVVELYYHDANTNRFLSFVLDTTLLLKPILLLSVGDQRTSPLQLPAMIVDLAHFDHNTGVFQNIARKHRKRFVLLATKDTIVTILS